MSSYLCLSVTFLDSNFHGRGDGGEPEWPPSPLRLFQALIAAAAARWGERQRLEYARPALRWLAEQSPPEIVGASGRTGSAYRLSVPNNAMDLAARAWSRGNTTGKGDANPATHRAMKTVRPTWLDGGDAVHYLWELPDPLPAEVQNFAEIVGAAARNIVALGWGVDLVAGHGRVISSEDAARLPGERWRPNASSTAEGLRVPTPGTLEALERRHRAFLQRLTSDGFTPVPALTAFAVVGYRTATDLTGRPFAAFELWQPAEKLAELPPGKSKFRPFDLTSDSVSVAAMVRHIVAEVAATSGWSPERINTFVHGHTPDGSDRAHGRDADRRFAYLPLPSITPRKVESIRRVLVAGPAGVDGAAAIKWARQALLGRELVRPGSQEAVAMLSPSSVKDSTIQQYVKPARIWSTVTPVILPGHEDPNGLRRRVKNAQDAEVQKRLLARLDRRVDALLRKAFEQAGLPSELVRSAELEWRVVGFRPGVEPALRYRLPESLNRLPRYHVHVRFPEAVRGPLTVGTGRYRGIGVFASDE